MPFSANKAITAHAGTVTFHIAAITAHTRNVTAHMRPFEPTSTSHEKMAKPFLFDSFFTPSDQNRLLKLISRNALSGVRYAERSEEIYFFECFSEGSEIRRAERDHWKKYRT